MTIRSRKYPYNMASWLAEKSQNACLHACCLAEELRRLPADCPAKEEMQRELHAVLYDLTKVIEYAYDTEFDAWQPGLADTMLEHGTATYRAFMARVKEFSDLESIQAFRQGER